MTDPQHKPERAADPDIAAAGVVTHDEARKMLQRFNASHWNDGREKARYTIPADPRRDDDIRMAAYIERNRARDEALRAAGLLDEKGEVRKVLGTLFQTDDGCIIGLDADVMVYREPVCGDVERQWIGDARCLDRGYRWFTTREAALAAKEDNRP